MATPPKPTRKAYPRNPIANRVAHDEESPWRRTVDPAGQQLLWELGRLAATERLNFRQGLERLDAQRNAEHERALQYAAARHEEVRRTAEAVRLEYELQLQIEREMRQQEELRRLEETRKAKAAQDLAAQQERTRLVQEADAAERAAAAAREEHAAALERARVGRERQAAEAARQREQRETQGRTAEVEAKAKAVAAVAVRAAPPSMPTAPPNPQQPVTDPTAAAKQAEREQEHQRYLQLHQKLKQLRKFVVAEAKKSPDIKTVVGDSRRAIRKCVGQLTEDLQANKNRLAEIIKILKNSLQFTNPQVDVSQFFCSPVQLSGDTQAPALMLYLLNIFAKALIAQFINETSVAPQTANPIGILGSSLFAQIDFQWEGRLSFIDFFLAKYHVVCPVLFGIYGSEKTAEGKQRLGWWRANGVFVQPQRHAERMTGLGAGFAAMSLRNYTRSRLSSPLPTHHWWGAAAAIMNVPAGQATSTHLIVLKAMIENSEPRILEFFGQAGRAVLRRALVDYPNRPEVQGTVAAKSLMLMKDLLRKTRKLSL